jgi:hypothetical protein
VKKCDQLQLAQLKLLTDRVISRLRKRLNIHATFVEVHSLEVEEATAPGMPKDAVGKALSGNATTTKRKHSKHEHRRDHGRQTKAKRAQQSIAVCTNTNFDASDERHLPAPKLDHRACSFCKKTKHFVGKCPSLHQHGVSPLPRGDLKCRTQLQADLTSGGRILTSTRDPTDHRTVFTSLPTGVGAIFIFKRFYVNNLNQNEQEYVDNYCVECTILKVGGDQHGEYNRSLFLVSCVATHIVKSQSNWIISMLQYTTNRQMVHEEPPSQFQTLQSQQPLSHLSQLSQKPIPHDPLQSLFWNTMNPAPSILDQRLAQVSNLMLSQSSQGPPQPTRFDFIGGHL